MAQVHCNFHSYSLHHPVDIEVTIPSVSSCDGRDGSPVTHTLEAKFPVLYLLHGGGNDYRSWLRYTSAERYAEEHRIALVTCSVSNSRYLNNEATREYYYDFLSKELPEFVCNYFPISSRPEDTFMCGYSMGGYGTIVHTFTTPERFTAVGFFSAGARRSTSNPENPFDVYTLTAKAKENGAKLPKIFMCIGEEDRYLDSAVEYHEYLEELGIEHFYECLPGYEHEFAIWDIELEKFMNWIPRSDYYADKIPHKI